MDNHLKPQRPHGVPILNSGWLDDVYYALKHYPQIRSGNRFFRYGWGDVEAISTVRDTFMTDKSIERIKVHWVNDWQNQDGCFIRDAIFKTPRYTQFIDEQVAMAKIRVVMPSPSLANPIYLHLATTGEEGFDKRYNSMANPLIKHGIGTVMLEHPFMGSRRAIGRKNPRFHYFSELVLFGGIVVEETRALVTWLHRCNAKKIGLFGISSGGHLAALSAYGLNMLDAIVPCIAPHSGVVAFTEGLLHRSCDWEALGREAECSANDALLIAKDHLSFTSVETFPPPSPTTKILAIAALNDRFVPSYSTRALLNHWPRAEVCWLRGGHVSTVAFQSKTLLQATIRMMGHS